MSKNLHATLLGLFFTAALFSALPAKAATRVFILAGQSNAGGGGVYVNQIPDPGLLVMPPNLVYYSNASSDPTQPSTFSESSMYGPEVSFGQILATAFPNEEIWIVRYAVGGSSMLAWKPDWSFEEAETVGDGSKGPLFTKLIEYVRTITGGHAVNISGFLWVQGETDSRSLYCSERYEENLTQFITRLRQELNAPDLPVVVPLVGCAGDYSPMVQQAEINVSSRLSGVRTVSTHLIPLRPDLMHYDAAGRLELGRRLTDGLSLSLTSEAGDTPPAIRPVGPRPATEDTALSPVQILVSDGETAAEALTVTAVAVNKELIPDETVVVESVGTERQVRLITPPAGAGSTYMTVRADDGRNATLRAFAFTTGRPSISKIQDVETAEDTPTPPIAFEIHDLESPAEQLTVSGSASNAQLVPVENLVFEGTGSNRTVTITPAPDKSASAAITLTVSDGTDSASTEFTLTVKAANDAPVAMEALFSTPEDTVLEGQLTARDVEGNALRFTLVTNGTLGRVTALDRTTGVFTYKPNTNISGTDTFTFQVSDGRAKSNVAMATVTILPVNDAPTALDQSVEVANDGTVHTIRLRASDRDSGSLIYTLRSAPAHGTCVLLSPNRVRYRPEAGFTGTDALTFSASDGLAESNTATVTIHIVQAGSE